MIRSMTSALSIMMVPGLAQAAAAPFIIGAASHGPGGSPLQVKVTKACPKGEMIQVLAVAVGAGAMKITAVDSGGVNIYQNGGGAWNSGTTRGSFLATTSPREATNAGLAPPATITVSYSTPSAWEAAIAACVPGLETTTGSADNRDRKSVV